MRLISFLFILLLAKAVASQDLPPEITAFIQQRIQAEMNPSIVVGILDTDGPRFFSFGHTKKGGKKVNEHTIYEIGSITKVFTGILLADMVVQGKMHLDDPIEKYLPGDLRIPEFNTHKITLGHLSSHISGLPGMPDNMEPADPANPYADYSFDKMLEFITSYELKRLPGAKYEYSNLAVGLLGEILAKEACTSYEDLMVAKIANPLQLNDTRIKLTRRMKQNLAAGHQQNVQVPNWDVGAFDGAGGIRSSAHDLLRFIEANILLTSLTLEKPMLLSHQPLHDTGRDIKVGLGWHISKGSKGDVIWHNGGTGGYSTFAGFVKETRTGVVVLTNSTESVDPIGFYLVDPGGKLPAVVPHISIRMKEMIDSKGHQVMLAEYDKIKKEQSEKFDFSEEGINALGYYYLNRKNYEEAKAVFQLNIREYPSSANVYDSYAEALMESGDTAGSISFYKRSLELNPGNQNAIQMLEKMGEHVTIDIPIVSTTLLESYTGTYTLFPSFEITVTLDGEQLIAQATGQGAYPIYPKTDHEFYYKIVDAQIVFNRNVRGVVESLTLHQGGRIIEGKKQ